MPNPPAHIDLAHRTAQLLRHPVLDGHMGYYLLGSTSPDVRVITRRAREEYHFAPLDFQDVGEGMHSLFESHPSLHSSSLSDGPTRAFVAGYITHLLSDETWIRMMYRPFFGNPDVFEDEATGKVMDRALQLELDRQAWDTVDATIHLLEAATHEIDVGFILPATLADWRRWVVSSLERGFSWERIRFMARRISESDESHPAHRLADEFCRSVPKSLDRLYEWVPRDNLVEYRSESLDSLACAVGDYLS